MPHPSKSSNASSDNPPHVEPYTQPVDPRLWRIWAKWSKTGEAAPEGGETYHPLICHVLDVRTVALHLWRNALPAPTRERLARHLGLTDDSDAAAWIAFFTGLHDIGKASPGFQDQLNATTAGNTIRTWLREAGLDFTGSEWVPHGAVSARVLGYMLEDLGLSSQLADQFAVLVGGHHGVFPRQLELNDLKDRHQVGIGSWNTIREELVTTLRAELRLPDPAPSGTLTPADALVFAGFVTVADWIGSNEYHFPHAGRLAAAPQPMALAEYLALTDSRATEALRTVRLDAFAASTEARTHRTFGELFPKIDEPRDAQQAIIEVADHLTGPSLVILEAPMGEGKTEAALYLADVWAATQDRQGAYIALPTQATSNQMFKRVRKYLGLRFANADYVAAHLVYGEAQLDDSYQKMLDQGRTALAASRSVPSTQHEPAVDEVVSEDGDEHALAEGKPASGDDTLALVSEGPVYNGRGEEAGEEGAVIAVEWFAASKRALIAPFGVGTIDQALLGVLQTKHFFVRLFGLAGKTVIVDEVHAYDTYMSALLDRLLEWLGAFGVPVVLLSATLPKAKRVEMQSAYAQYAGLPVANGESDKTPYPRLTWLSAAGPDARSVKASSDMSRPVQMEWLDREAPDPNDSIATVAERLSAALADGGCAAVVCNTVRRAQAVYRALHAAFAHLSQSQRPALHLLHAQMLREERQRREKFVIRAFGLDDNGKRNSDRPHRAVLVATQVIEQSLDLDFDLMVSDLAPVDLLLQRSGRLHRHRENDPYRPPAVGVPRLLIPRLDERDGCPQFPKSDEFIYDTHILLRTWLALQGRTEIRVPEDIEALVERVYNPDVACPAGLPPAVRDAWNASRSRHEYAVEHDLDEARIRRVSSPKDDAAYKGRNLMLKDVDEAPQAEETALALTRLGPPSVRGIVLPASWARRQQAAKGRPPSRDVTRRLLGRSVSLSHAAVAPALIHQEPPTQWKKSPWLRHARLVALDDADQATITIPGKQGATGRTYILKLDRVLGVIIERQGKEDE